MNWEEEEEFNARFEEPDYYDSSSTGIVLGLGCAAVLWVGVYTVLAVFLGWWPF